MFFKSRYVMGCDLSTAYSRCGSAKCLMYVATQIIQLNSLEYDSWLMCLTQEQQRYDQPHKAFTFRMHGFESVVGPVKGVFDKETSLNKAREHSLLRSDRPAYVTILSLGNMD